MELESKTWGHYHNCCPVAKKINRVQEVFSSWLASLRIFLLCGIPCSSAECSIESLHPGLRLGCSRVVTHSAEAASYTSTSLAGGELASLAPWTPAASASGAESHASFATSA